MNRHSYERSKLGISISHADEQDTVLLASEDFRVPVLLDMIYDEGIVEPSSPCAFDAELEAMSQLSIEIAGTYGLDSEGIDEAIRLAREKVVG